MNTTVIFMVFLMVLDALIGVQGKNIWLFVDFVTHLQDKSALWNVKLVYYMPNSSNIDAFHEDWMWLDAKNIDVNSHTSVCSKLATCGIWSLDESCSDCVGGSASAEKRQT
jgi:hypothetical protein